YATGARPLPPGDQTPRLDPERGGPADWQRSRLVQPLATGGVSIRGDPPRLTGAARQHGATRGGLDMSLRPGRPRIQGPPSDRPVSRQRMWQLRMRLAGRCMVCGQGSKTRGLCIVHSKANSARVKRWSIKHPPTRAARDARNALLLALKRGEVVRPSVCSACRIPDPKISGYHPNPVRDPGTIIWLCYRCMAAARIARQIARDG